MRFSLGSLLLFVAAIGVLLAATLFLWRTSARQNGASGENVTAAAANKMLWSDLRLPEVASDVSYFVDFGSCEAEFAIDEEALRDWCAANGWAVQPLGKPTPYFEPMWLPSDPRVIDSGFRYMMPNGEGIFDASRSRTGFWVSTFP